MKTVVIYITRMFLTRFGICLLGFAALLQLLDLVENIRDLTIRDGGGFDIFLFYVGLRLPALITQMLPISVLLGTLLTLLTLANNNEIIALKSVGMSFYKTLVCMLPIGITVAGAYYLFSDLVTPYADRKLQTWWNETTPLSAQTLPPKVWLRDGRSVVSVDRIQPNGRELFGLVIYVRDSEAIASERISARRAIFADGDWLLTDVTRQKFIGNDVGLTETFSELAWDTKLSPVNLAELSVPPRFFTVRQLWRIVHGEWIGSRALYFYEARLQKKIASPISLLLMLLIAAPVAQTIRRHGSGGLALVLGISIGFSYFIVDGLVLTLGEGGVLPGALAAWVPTLIFASVGGAILVHREQ